MTIVPQNIPKTICWGVSVLALLTISGCTIDQYTGPATGDLFVTALDVNGNQLAGASIYLDGILRSEITPDTLKNIVSGLHYLRIEHFGYQVYGDSVAVEPYVVNTYQATLITSNTGTLCVSAAGGVAMVIVDGHPLEGQAPGTFSGVPAGVRQVSVFREGYLTSPDTLVPAEIAWQETTQVHFEITPGTLGNQVGNAAPDFTLQNDNLDSISMHNYRGRVVLVDFWFRDCYFCILEFPDLQEVYEEYNHRGFQILAVNPYDPLEVIIEVREDPDLLPTFQLLMDPEHQVEYNYGVTIYPANLLVDGSGEIRYRFGHTTAAELRSMLDDIYGSSP
jgi:peroxiredoxin